MENNSELEVQNETDILARYPRIVPKMESIENNNFWEDDDGEMESPAQHQSEQKQECEDLSKKMKRERVETLIDKIGNESPLDMRKQRRKQAMPQQYPDEQASTTDMVEGPQASPSSERNLEEERLEQLLKNYKADMIGFVERAFEELRRNLRVQMAREMATAQLTDIARRNLVANLAHVASMSKVTPPGTIWPPFGIAPQASAWHRAYPSSLYNYPHIPLPQFNFGEQKPTEEQLSMILNPPKRKRTKVTDTRIAAARIPRSGDADGDSYNDEEDGCKSAAPLSSTPSGGTPSPNSSPTQSDYSMSVDGLQTTQLTPMHLRKAKLMFFYVRYPSSALLKSFFPDVLFNKNNTAQLVKWFSNFREFFYIQMEKYARQFLANGMVDSMQANVKRNDDLMRTLNIHYNRNNQLPIPDHFVTVAEKTLQEFFRAIQQAKDAEPSWKKAIYKVIQRSDDMVPEFFKSTTWMEQLAD